MDFSFKNNMDNQLKINLDTGVKRKYKSQFDSSEAENGESLETCKKHFRFRWTKFLRNNAA